MSQITEVFDAEFRKVFEVPTSCVAHLPPARLNITRLVLCRNYRSGERDSCAMGANCKFVHADCDYAQLPTHSIHVNYLWRELNLCTYARIADNHSASVDVPLRLWADSITVGPDGCVTDTMASSATAVAGGGASHHAGHHISSTNTNGSYVMALASQQLLRTTGSLQFMALTHFTEPLVSCEAYELDGICRQGEDCAFAHRVIVDPSTKSAFKRAPRRRHPNCASTNTGHNSVANSPRFAPLAPGLVSATATPILRAQGHAPPASPAVPPHSPHQSPLPPRGASDTPTLSKHGAGSSVEAHSGLATPASSSLGLTTAATGTFGLKMEQWVQRAVRVQLLTTVPGATSGSGPHGQSQANSALWTSAGPGPSASAAVVEEGAVVVVIPAAMAATLSATDSIGTLLYVPRGSDHATVLGPVTAEDVLPNSQ